MQVADSPDGSEEDQEDRAARQLTSDVGGLESLMAKTVAQTSNRPESQRPQVELTWAAALMRKSSGLPSRPSRRQLPPLPGWPQAGWLALTEPWYFCTGAAAMPPTAPAAGADEATPTTPTIPPVRTWGS